MRQAVLSVVVATLAACTWGRDERDSNLDFDPDARPNMTPPTTAPAAGSTPFGSGGISAPPPRRRRLMPGECGEANVRRSEATCFAEFAVCNVVNDGTFCGEACRGELDCDELDCSDYLPLEEDSCDANAHVFEGTCGDTRYRVENLGSTSERRFWNAASGKLVAVHAMTDSARFCGGADFAMIFGDAQIVLGCDVQFDESMRLCGAPQCGVDVAIRGIDGCNIELLEPMPDPVCTKTRVKLDGKDLGCDDADGWRALDSLRIQLSGTACDALLDDPAKAVSVVVGCEGGAR